MNGYASFNCARSSSYAKNKRTAYTCVPSNNVAWGSVNAIGRNRKIYGTYTLTKRPINLMVKLKQALVSLGWLWTVESWLWMWINNIILFVPLPTYGTISSNYYFLNLYSRWFSILDSVITWLNTLCIIINVLWVLCFPIKFECIGYCKVSCHNFNRKKGLLIMALSLLSHKFSYLISNFHDQLRSSLWLTDSLTDANI